MKKLNICLGIILLVINCVSIIAQSDSIIVLPLPIKTGGMPIMEALNARSSAREFSPKEFTLQELSNIMWAADGINRPESGKRTAPTAMNWQDVDIYAVLHSGIYLYSPKENKLILRKRGDFMKITGKQKFVTDAPLNIVIISDFSKMKSSSKEEKILYAGIHAGSVSQNIYLYCASMGLNTVTRRYIDIEELSKIMDIKPEEKIVLAQTVGFKP